MVLVCGRLVRLCSSSNFCCCMQNSALFVCVYIIFIFMMNLPITRNCFGFNINCYTANQILDIRFAWLTLSMVTRKSKTAKSANRNHFTMIACHKISWQYPCCNCPEPAILPLHLQKFCITFLFYETFKNYFEEHRFAFFFLVSDF